MDQPVKHKRVAQGVDHIFVFAIGAFLISNSFVVVVIVADRVIKLEVYVFHQWLCVRNLAVDTLAFIVLDILLIGCIPVVEHSISKIIDQ